MDQAIKKTIIKPKSCIPQLEKSCKQKDRRKAVFFAVTQL